MTVNNIDGCGLSTRAMALCSLLLMGAVLFLSAPAFSTARTGPVFVLDVKGPIGVAVSMHVCRALDEGQKRGVEVVVLSLNTPGGLLNATRDVIQCILASTVPVAVYISPSGARAASAGTYITYAAHIAAMAPGTHLGAATPVAMSAPFAPRDPTKPRAPKSEKDAAPDTAMDRKILNDSIAYLQSLAQLRGRNSEWAEKAVRDAATLTAEDAARERVVDILANDVRDLLLKIDGRTTKVAGVERRVTTQDREVVVFEPDWKTRLLGSIADPNIALILLMIGVYGLLFEFWSPGSLVPGVIGGISLMLGLVALSVLPVSYGGLALVLLGVALMVAEAFAPGLGILGIGGLVAFVVGALFLFDPAASDIDLALAWPVVIGAALTSVLLLSVVLGFAVKAGRRPAMTGAEEMIGLEGQVISWDGTHGAIRVHGEEWAGLGSTGLQTGQRVRVLSREGMTLTVEPI